MSNNASETLKRQPYAAIVMVLIQIAISLFKALWPMILIIWFKGSSSSTSLHLYIIFIPPAIVLILAFLNYLQFKYGVIENKFILKKGFFKKIELSIPLNSIQAIHIDQTVLDKILSLVTVTLDTTGTNKEEAKLHLTNEDAQALRKLILENKEDIPDEPSVASTEGNIVSSLSIAELLKLSLTANHLETFLVILGLTFSFLEDIKSLFKDVFDRIVQEYESAFLTSGFTIFIYLIILILIISIIGSFVKTFFTYANFKIKKIKQGFAVESGLINKREQVVNFDKIQFISWNSNWLRKNIPIYVLEYHAIGNQEVQKFKIKIPAMSIASLGKLIGIYGEVIDPTKLNYSISKIFISRKVMILGIFPAAIGGSILFYFFGLISLLTILLPVLVYFISKKIQTKYKIHFNEDILHIRKGAFGDSQILIQWHKIQSINLIQSYYQQKKAVANLRISTAGGFFTIPYMDLAEARALRNYALLRLESAVDKKWM